MSLAGVAAGSTLSALVERAGADAVPEYSLSVDAPTRSAGTTDWVQRNDAGGKARDLGVIGAGAVFSGLTVEAGTSDRFGFATPRDVAARRGVVHVSAVGGATLTAELYSVDAAGNATQVASDTCGDVHLEYGYGVSETYRLEVTGGAGVSYQFRFEPTAARGPD
ncbi:MAG: hypothetical protein K2P78_02915 [Gemmataceae bacterium]|nr:hypothetical protein [Gemmataceae bacterium]